MDRSLVFDKLFGTIANVNSKSFTLLQLSLDERKTRATEGFIKIIKCYKDFWEMMEVYL